MKGMYEFLGISLSLAALLCVNALATALSGCIWRFISKRVAAWPAHVRAQIIFILRTSPAAFSISFVLLLLVPSYLAYEPAATSERVSIKLALLALLSIAGLGLACWRGLSAWRATRRLLKDWLAHSERVSLEGVGIPAYSVEHAFPIIAVVGAFRPRLFIASHLLESLSARELAAALAHERGHLKARDNLKRTIMRACRDALVILPTGRVLDRAWAEAAEGAADEYTASKDDKLDLASALVKIARLVPEDAKPTMPAGAFLVGEPQGVEARVRKLLTLAETRPKKSFSRAGPKLLRWGYVSLLLIILTVAVNPRTLAAMHYVTEHIVCALK